MTLLGDRQAVISTIDSQIPPGSLVSCRGRLWVVIPSSDADMILLKPADGREEDHIGIYKGLGLDFAVLDIDS